MKKTILVVLLTLVTILPARAQDVSMDNVQILNVMPPQSGGGACTFFRAKGMAWGSWIAQPMSDPSAATIAGYLLSWRLSQSPISFATNGAACGFPRLWWVFDGSAG